MKLIGRFALAFLAIAALVNSVVAIDGSEMTFVANSYGASSLVATFDAGSQDKSNRDLLFELALPGAIGDYRNMRCVFERDTDSNSSAASRTSNVFLVESLLANGIVIFKGSNYLGSNAVLRKFKFACSFNPFITITRSVTASATAAVENDKGYTSTHPVIHPFNGFAEKFEVTLSSVTNLPTAFKITKPFFDMDRRVLRVRNPDAKAATSGTNVFFSSSENTSNCHAYRDDVLDLNSVTAITSGNADYVDLLFSFPLNASSEILVRCHDLFGKKTSNLLPAILEVVDTLSLSHHRLNYAHTRLQPSSASSNTFESALELFL